MPCAGLTGRLFGHRFGARYDRNGPDGEALEASGGMCVEFSGAEPNRIYVADVCSRCGMQVSRATPQPKEDRE